MSQITVHGGKPLKGRVDLKGAKNLVTKAMVAALLGETPSVLKDVPFISDVEIVSRLLQLHGVNISHSTEGEMTIDPRDVSSALMADINAHAGSSMPTRARAESLSCSVARWCTVLARHSFLVLVVVILVTAQSTITLQCCVISAR